jgi:phage repressor protein C with HTH and peptisase S24 domain
MGWATNYIAKLKEGETVTFRPRGNSMSGKINSGDLCMVSPITGEIKNGDIVLCKVNGNEYLHLVKAKRGDHYQIGNNKGHINGWTPRKNIFGVLTNVE